MEALVALKSRLQNPGIGADEVERNLRLLLQLRETSLGAAISQLVNSGWVYHYLIGYSGNSRVAAAAVLVIILSDSEGNQGTNATQQTPQGRNHYRNIVSLPQGNMNIVDDLCLQAMRNVCVEPLLAKRAENTIAKPILDLVLRNLAGRENCCALFSADVIVAQYLTLKSALDANALDSLLKASLES